MLPLLVLTALLGCRRAPEPSQQPPGDDPYADPIADRRAPPDPLAARAARVEALALDIRRAIGTGDAKVAEAAWAKADGLSLSPEERDQLHARVFSRERAAIGWMQKLLHEGKGSKAPEGPPVLETDPAGFALVGNEAWVVAVPVDATRYTLPGTELSALVVGEGRLPDRDGMLQPLQTGVQVEATTAATPTQALEAIVTRERQAASATPRLEAPKVPPTEPGATATTPMVWRAVPPDTPERLATYAARAMVGADGVVYVATAWVVGSRLDNHQLIDGCGVKDLVTAHVTAFAPTLGAVDRSALTAAYRAYDARVGGAMRAAVAANAAVSEGRHAEAITELEAALAVCEPMSFAHNGLAWSLLHVEPPRVEDAVTHAERAVALNKRESPSALDTLLRACEAKGDEACKARALKDYERVTGGAWRP